LLGQVVAVSVRDNSQLGEESIVTGFHMNLPDGTALTKCFQINRNRQVALSFEQAYVLQIDWIGQNSAGFIYEPMTVYLQLYSKERRVIPSDSDADE
jgi:hypothetical protein